MARLQSQTPPKEALDAQPGDGAALQALPAVREFTAAQQARKHRIAVVALTDLAWDLASTIMGAEVNALCHA